MNTVNRIFDEGGGVLRLTPTWVPRAFCRPGMRIKLHPDDAYKLGLERGGIDERWFASTTHAENGPKTPEDEGMSYAVSRDGKEKALLAEFVEELKAELIGEEIYNQYGKWPMFSKFFDNMGPLPHHVHHRDEHAKLVGCEGKPEMYFFPSQLNNYGGEFPFTFFGFKPGTTKEQVKECLMNFTKGDNKLLDLSTAYKLTLDTGWDVPPGVLHAPGSLCTYEPQFASDVYAMYQSVLYYGHTVSEDLLWKNCPQDKLGDFDYLVDVIDWDLNVDEHFAENRMMQPIPVYPEEEMKDAGYYEEWICYRCPQVYAKRLIVLPRTAVTIRDDHAYGFIMLQGHGTLDGFDIETPALIRYGEQTNDEFFVSAKKAREGVTIFNPSDADPIVMLKHFAGTPAILRK